MVRPGSFKRAPLQIPSQLHCFPVPQEAAKAFCVLMGGPNLCTAWVDMWVALGSSITTTSCLATSNFMVFGLVRPRAESKEISDWIKEGSGSRLLAMSPNSAVGILFPLQDNHTQFFLLTFIPYEPFFITLKALPLRATPFQIISASLL